VNYNRVLKTIFEQNRKELIMGWRKLLDMELPEMYNLLDKLLTN
jgi:hypothetical protein